MSVIQKVAILKSRLYKGGVAQVLGHMILAFNERGIIPDILTLRSDLTVADFKKLYQLEIKFNIKFIGPDLKMPYEWHFLYFNLISYGYSKKYDLFINSNNTSFFAPRNIKTITYVHFPRKFRILSENRSIHFPELKNKSWADIQSDPFYIAKFLSLFDKHYGKNEILIANSDFTKRSMESVYAITGKSIEVIYPPVENPVTGQLDKKMQVVTLGRISDEKRQLEQIEIAKGLPDIHFYLLGFSNKDAYFKQCEDLIVQYGLKNVSLLPNLDHSEIQKILSESAIFLHNVRNEPFGIGIVQAAAQNCIPVIHGSGGAVEIVSNKELHFNSIGEARQIIERIKKGEIAFTFNHIFSPTEFKNKFNVVLNAIQ